MMTNKRSDPRVVPLSITAKIGNDVLAPTVVHIDNISMGGAKISYQHENPIKSSGELHLSLEGYGDFHTTFDCVEIGKNCSRIQFKQTNFKDRLLLTHFLENYQLVLK
jgi:hypothetical protein